MLLIQKETEIFYSEIPYNMKMMIQECEAVGGVMRLIPKPDGEVTDLVIKKPKNAVPQARHLLKLNKQLRRKSQRLGISLLMRDPVKVDKRDISMIRLYVRSKRPPPKTIPSYCYK